MTSISTKYLLENAEVTKNKNDQSNPKKWRPNTEASNATGPPLVSEGSKSRFQQNSQCVQVMFKAKTIYKKSGQMHQKHTHDQWHSAARVSMSKCTNPCYMTHRVLKARMNYCINQNPGQKITSKPNTEALQCHWLPATRFQRVQNPDPNKLYNVSKSCSR